MSSSFDRGQRGEDIVASWLKRHKYKIIATNAKTTHYEIDIIAKRKKVLFFVEVKLRSSKAQGSGFDYITPRKLQQMNYAAQSWVATNNYTGPYKLAAASVDGASEQIVFTDEIWLENVS